MAKEQEQKRTQRREDAPPETTEDAPRTATTGEALKEEMDAILDEIDAVLEENAEEFVKGYVQKGGQ
ncbi:MAG: ubiquitin-like protein Pup [Actinomycetota bacterium]